MQLGQVVAQRHFALALQRVAQGVGGDVGVAVAVATNPVAHAQKAVQLMAGQGFFQLGIELGNLAQKGGLVIGQRVLDLVSHGQLGVAQHARLPELGDAGADEVLVVALLALGVQVVALAHQLGDGALGIEDALALHLGRVGRQHRRDEAVLQGLGHFGRAHASVVQPLHAVGQRAGLKAAGALMDLAATHMVAVFGDVGEVREVAEGADHADRLLAREALEQLVEDLAGLRVALEAEGHGQLAHPFDQLIGVAALLLANHLAEDAA